MSSSRVIKSVHHDESGVSDFSFRPVGQAVGVADTPGADSFIPMGMFTGFELAGGNAALPEEPEPAGPPSVDITEEELNQRLNDAFNAGLQEGKNLAERGLVNVFRALRGASETIHNLRDKVLRESEDEVLNLIMLVARKVIIREVAQDRTILAGVVQNAIAGLSDREEITVRINPDDYALVASGREEMLRKELTSERLRLKPDPNVQLGCCQVDTEMGTVNADMDAQLEEIYRHLLEERTATAEND